MQTLLFWFATFGLTFILVYGHIFDKIRPKNGWFGQLFKCSLCLAIWAATGLCLISPWLTLINVPTVLDGLVLIFSSSGFTYFMSMLGIWLEKEIHVGK